MNAAELSQTINSLFVTWLQAEQRHDKDAMRILTNDLDASAEEAVEFVKRAGGTGSVVHQVLAHALAPVREKVVPVAQRLTDAKWPA